jgi:anti-anti-sigma factor
MAVETIVDAEKKVLEIKISGRFDFSVHQDFRKAMQQASNDITAIVVSSALGMLLVLRDKVGENKEAISIKSAKPEVRKILDIANFDKLFTLN